MSHTRDTSSDSGRARLRDLLESPLTDGDQLATAGFIDTTQATLPDSGSSGLGESSSGYHDFDLAEFPWAVLSRGESLGQR